MRDITAKPETLRTARAEARIVSGDDVDALLAAARADKGDALEIARVAGIMAAKKTWEAIPFCHQIPVTHSGVTFALSPGEIRVEATCTTVAPTGCEIEALHAATTAALTVYDVLKPHTDDLAIEGIRLLEKRGGKSDYRVAPDPAVRVAVIVTHGAIASGRKPDRAGELVRDAVRTARGATLVFDEITGTDALLDAVSRAEPAADLILTVGGTGVASDDATVDTIRGLLERDLPGVMEAVRSYGQRRTPRAMVSRGVAGVTASGTVIATLPGSTGGAEDALAAAFDGMLHIAAGVRGTRSAS